MRHGPTWTLVAAAALALVLASGLVGVGAAQPAPENDSVPSQQAVVVDGVEIGPQAAAAEGEATVIVRLTEAREDPSVTAQSAGDYRAYADRSQVTLERFAARTPGVEISRSFWITNAVLLEVDTDRVPLERVAQVDDVERIHANYEVEPMGAGAAAGSSASSGPTIGGGGPVAGTQSAQSDRGDYTYGLEMINAPETWNRLGVRGEGVSVAVLDTGVNASHPDISIDSDNWAEFDENGNEVEVEPHDDHGHGTHVAGTIFGGNASGTHIGVAPEATHHHANVMSGPAGSGTFASVTAGMQWAVQEQDVDVISMSLGRAGYVSDYAEPVRNALDSDVFVVAAIGNEDQYHSGSPGNLPTTFSVGAVEEDLEVYAFSGGERISTAEAWGDAAESSWPGNYTVPDVVAPGVDVYSAAGVPEDGSAYMTRTGTSMATPHVAGTAALVLSASDEYDGAPDRLADHLRETASEPSEDHHHNITHGTGVVDALGATANAMSETTVSGTVVDGDGEPVAGIPVESDLGPRTTTDDSGAFTLQVPSAEQTVRASFGYETPESASINASASGHVDGINLSVEGPEPTIEVVRDAPAYARAGGSFDIRVRIAHADTYNVDPASTGGPGQNVSGGLDSPYDATLRVDGEATPWGDPVNQSGEGVVSTVDLEVSTPGDHVGEITLRHILLGTDGGENFELLSTRATGTTAISPEVVEVPGDVDPDSLQAVVDVTRPRGTIELGSRTFRESYDETFGGGRSVLYPEERSVGVMLGRPVTIRAAPGAEPVIALQHPPDDEPSDAVHVNADDVTVRGVTIDAGGGDVGFRATFHDGLIFEENRVRNATTATWFGTEFGIVFEGLAPAEHRGRPFTGRFQDNELVDVTYGLRGSNLFMDDISGNRIDAAVAGIQLGDHSGPFWIANNTITVSEDGHAPIVVNDTSSTYYNNTLEGGEYGLLQMNATVSPSEIVANTVRNTSVAGIELRRSTPASGIVIGGGDRRDPHVIESNTVEHGSGDGIRAPTDRDTEIVENTVRHVEGSGITAEVLHGREVSNNSVRDVGGTGIVVSEVHDGEVSNNSVVGATTGIALSAVDSPDVFENDVSNATTGISAVDAAGLGIGGANVNADRRGIVLRNATSVSWIAGSTIASEDGGSVVVEGSPGVLFVNNTVEFGGDGTAVGLHASDGLHATDNDLAGGSLSLTDLEGAELANNSVADAAVGLALANASDVHAEAGVYENVSLVLDADRGTSDSTFLNATSRDPHAGVAIANQSSVDVEALAYPGQGITLDLAAENVLVAPAEPPTPDLNADDGVFLDVSGGGGLPSITATVRYTEEAFGGEIDQTPVVYLYGEGAWAPYDLVDREERTARISEDGLQGTFAILDGLPNGSSARDTPALFVGSVDAPATVEPGETYTVTSTVASAGAAAENATVELLADGEVVANATVDVPELGTTSVEFEHAAGSEGTVEHEVRVGDVSHDVSVDVEADSGGGGSGGGDTGGSGGGGGGGSVGGGRAIDVDVGNVSVSDTEVEPGETVTVTMEVTNVGDRSGVRDVELVDGLTVLDSVSVALTEGQTREVTLEGSLDELGTHEFGFAGEHVATVEVVEEVGEGPNDGTGGRGNETGDGGDGAAPDLRFAASAPETVPAGQAAAVTVTAANHGDAAGETDVVVRVGGERVLAETVAVEPGDTVVRDHELSTDEPRDLDWEVLADGEPVEAGTVAVEADDDPEEREATGNGDDGLPGFGVAPALLGVLIAAGLAARRRD